jgi:hypothetical protein
MATNATQSTEETLTLPVRPEGVTERATWIGSDDAGREHFHRGAIPRGTVVVAEDGAVVERVELPAREHTTDTRLDTVADWLEHVADRCGWSRRAGDVDLVGRLADGVEEGHDR